MNSIDRVLIATLLMFICMLAMLSARVINDTAARVIHIERLMENAHD